MSVGPFTNSAPSNAPPPPATTTTNPPPAGGSTPLWLVEYAVDFRPPRSAARRYGVAVVAVVAALLLTVWLKSITPPTYRSPSSALFFAAVMVGAWYGGLGPGLLATGIAAFSIAYFVLDPGGSLEIGLEGVLNLGVFVFTSILISSLTALRWKAEEALKHAHGDLEKRVRERTAALRAINESLQSEIGERRRVEGALRQSEERFRLLVEGVEDYAMFMLDPAGHVVSWNPGAERITGFREEEITGRHITQFFPAEDVQRGKPEQLLQAAAAILLPTPALAATPLPPGAVAAAPGASAAALSTGYEEEGWRVRKDGSRFWANVLITPLRDEQGNLRGFAQVMRDITERKNLEAAILEISEREQRRIGHDLHDGLGQELTGIAFLSKVLEQRLGGQSPEEAAGARQIAELVNQTIKQTRELARGLSPVELEVDGLGTALAQLAKRAEGRYGISCRLEWDRSVSVVDHTTATHLYRIAQEALNNAVRHGGARHVVIGLANVEDEIVLGVTDDGAGFPLDLAGTSKGMGLHVMNYRARTIGGSLEIARGPDGAGTVVSCALPRAVEESRVVGTPMAAADAAAAPHEAAAGNETGTPTEPPPAPAPGDGGDGGGAPQGTLREEETVIHANNGQTQTA